MNSPQHATSEALGHNVHKLPVAPAEKPKRISKAMRALLETTVTEAEDKAYAKGFEEGSQSKFATLIVGITSGGIGGFLVGLVVHLAK